MVRDDSHQEPVRRDGVSQDSKQLVSVHRLQETESSNSQGSLSTVIHIAPVDQHKTTFTCSFGTFAYTRMSFGLCNAFSTFQRCMISIFSDLLEDCIHFSWMISQSMRITRSMPRQPFKGIVLGHLVSTRGIEVDKAKIDVISSLPNHASMREELKRRLRSSPILQAPNWELPFELICDASNSMLGAILGQQLGKQSHVIAYASRTMDAAQVNYTSIEKEFLAIVFALDKFRSYLLGSKIVVFSNYAALKYLLKKPDAKLRLIRWMILLQEFNIEIRDKKGAENVVADHLSWLEKEAKLIPIQGEFPDKQILQISATTLSHPCTL
ncbi:Retrovirus-related Pol polyprotein from transposon 17.6, partial [Mucuna pruriens]